MRRREGSPSGWRSGASRAPVALLVGSATLLGASAAGHRPARLLVRWVTATTAVSGPILALAAARGRQSMATARPGFGDGTVGGRPAVTILIPARDEAPVVGQLIADLGRAITARDKADGSVRVMVIDDRSTDGTAEIADAALAAGGFGAAGTVVRRTDGPDGKGAALAWAGPGDPDRLLVVLDADARIGPGFIDQVREALATQRPLAATGRAAVPLRHGREPVAATARRRMLRPVRAGLLTRALVSAQDVEQGVDDLVLHGRLALGGSAEFRGDGMAIRARALAAIGGWPAGALCEDLHLSARLATADLGPVARPPGLEVWEQPVTGLRPLTVQRLRWAEGAVRRDVEVVLPALCDRSLPVGRRAELATWALQALVPWTVIGLASRIPGDRSGRAARLAGELTAAYALAFATLGWVAAGDEPAVSPARRCVRTLAVVGLGGLWLAVLPVAWVRVALHAGQPRFDRTRHAPAATFSAPPPGRLPGT